MLQENVTLFTRILLPAIMNQKNEPSGPMPSQGVTAKSAPQDKAHEV